MNDQKIHETARRYMFVFHGILGLLTIFVGGMMWAPGFWFASALIMVGTNNSKSEMTAMGAFFALILTACGL